MNNLALLFLGTIITFSMSCSNMRTVDTYSPNRNIASEAGHCGSTSNFKIKALHGRKDLKPYGQIQKGIVASENGDIGYVGYESQVNASSGKTGYCKVIVLYNYDSCEKTVYFHSGQTYVTFGQTVKTGDLLGEDPSQGSSCDEAELIKKFKK